MFPLLLMQTTSRFFTTLHRSAKLFATQNRIRLARYDTYYSFTKLIKLRVTQNLYALSEVAQELIKAYCKGRQWSLQGYPGKVKLPSEIFRGLPSDSARKTVRVLVNEGALEN